MSCTGCRGRCGRSMTRARRVMGRSGVRGLRAWRWRSVRRGLAWSMCALWAGQPYLVGDQPPVRVELVVAQSFGYEVEAALVDHRNPCGAVDKAAVDARPDRSCCARVGGL